VTTEEGLRIEVERLKGAVRLHYEQRGDSRCHLDDLKLYHDALGIDPDPYVTALPPDEDMEESCRRYRRQRQCPTVSGTYPLPGGMTIAQLTAEVERLRIERDEFQQTQAAIIDRNVYELEECHGKPGGWDIKGLWFASAPFETKEKAGACLLHYLANRNTDPPIGLNAGTRDR
jgi:hypothetical protein